MVGEDFMSTKIFKSGVHPLPAEQLAVVVSVHVHGLC